MEIHAWHSRLPLIISAFRSVLSYLGLAPFLRTLCQQLLEVEDLCDSDRPDERSVMTYIASFFHAFSTMGQLMCFRRFCSSQIAYIDQAETVSRRVEKFAELMQSVWTSKNDYERRARNVRRFSRPLSFRSDCHP